MGHVKIETGNTVNLDDVYYHKNPRLERIRRETHETLQKLYGDRYVEYQGRSTDAKKAYGFIYFMYWFFITDEPKPRMFISDAYLPIHTGELHADKWKFSLFFPVSLMDCGDTFVVTGGEGDFYCVSLRFRREIVLTPSFLRHDVTTINVRKDYQFHRVMV